MDAVIWLYQVFSKLKFPAKPAKGLRTCSLKRISFVYIMCYTHDCTVCVIFIYQNRDYLFQKVEISWIYDERVIAFILFLL